MQDKILQQIFRKELAYEPPQVALTILAAKRLNSLNTSDEGWQMVCWEFAKVKEQFEVNGQFTEGNLLFFESLCDAYNYELKLRDNGFVFTPKIQAMPPAALLRSGAERKENYAA